MVTRWSIVSLMLAACLFGAALAEAQGQAQDVGGAFIQAYQNGQINWQTGLITAIGIGAPPANPVNMAQARAMAQRAATVVARRNLLEVVKGVQIDSATTVENYIVTNDVILSQVNGFLQNSQVLNTAYMSDGSVEVTVGINLRGGFADVLIPKTVVFKQETPPPPAPEVKAPVTTPAAPETKAPEVKAPETPPAPATPAAPAAPAVPAVDTAKVYTGLLVDARGLGARPAMSPKITDENGQEVYGTTMVSREWAIQQGMAGYSKDPAAAASNPRVTDSPLNIKAVKAEGKGKTNLVIGNDEANAIRKVVMNQNFLEKCRVMILLD